MSKNSKRVKKLDKLTLKASMLSRVLNDALSVYADQDEICEISYLSEILEKNFREIRAVF